MKLRLLQAHAQNHLSPFLMITAPLAPWQGRIGTIGALGGSRDFILMHLAHLSPFQAKLADEVKGFISAKITKFIVETL